MDKIDSLMLKTAYSLMSALRKSKPKEIARFLRGVYDQGFRDGSGVSADFRADYKCGACGGDLTGLLYARFCPYCGAELDYSEVDEVKEQI